MVEFLWRNLLGNNYAAYPPLNWNSYTHVIHTGDLVTYTKVVHNKTLPKVHDVLLRVQKTEAFGNPKSRNESDKRAMKWMMKCKTGHLCLCVGGGIAIITYSSGQRKRREEVWTPLRFLGMLNQFFFGRALLFLKYSYTISKNPNTTNLWHVGRKWPHFWTL